MFQAAVPPNRLHAAVHLPYIKVQHAPRKLLSPSSWLSPGPQVLQQEVHYSPNHTDAMAQRALRRPKRYRVPESPLLQVGLLQGLSHKLAAMLCGWGCGFHALAMELW